VDGLVGTDHHTLFAADAVVGVVKDGAGPLLPGQGRGGTGGDTRRRVTLVAAQGEIDALPFQPHHPHPRTRGPEPAGLLKGTSQFAGPAAGAQHVVEDEAAHGWFGRGRGPGGFRVWEDGGQRAGDGRRMAEQRVVAEAGGG